jgi:hypothetical protein
MNTNPSTTETESKPPADRGVRRREVVATGVGIGAALIAGCTGEAEDPSSTDAGDAVASSGRFRLLVSDAPADIDDFEELVVTLDGARLFHADEETETNETTDEEIEANETTDEEMEANETDEEETESNETDDDAAADTQAGFTTVEIDDATVDLTQVIGADAVSVFDGDLAEGRYAKLELNVAAAEGIVDGESVAVKVPSERLQITKPFTVRPDETVDFVFDITVVKRGQTNGYVLQPVVSESGVAGRDVEMREVGADGSGANASNGAGAGDGSEADEAAQPNGS